MEYGFITFKYDNLFYLITPILTATFIFLTSYICGQVHEDEYGFHVPTAVAVKSLPTPPTQLIGRVPNGVWCT